MNTKGGSLLGQPRIEKIKQEKKKAKKKRKRKEKVDKGKQSNV